MVYELTLSGAGWMSTVLYSIDPDGGYGVDPIAGLTFDKAGSLYGATSGYYASFSGECFPS